MFKRILSTTYRITTTAILCGTLASCGITGRSGPDKTVSGGLIGAGWGGTTGAIIGNQIAAAGEGLAVGSGLGFVAGSFTGLGYDLIDNDFDELEDKIAQLKLQNDTNAFAIASLQQQLDEAMARGANGQVYTLYFDTDATSLRKGELTTLDSFVQTIVGNPAARNIIVRGHSDDAGSPDYSKKVSSARARTVESYLLSKGISSTRISTESLGDKQPVASNSTPEGKQLNRRVEIIVN